MIKTILKELKEHAPYTFLGAVMGILLSVFLKNMPYNITFKLFYVFHPGHVLLSAFVTTSMYKLHKEKPKLIMIVLVGLAGSIGVASLSDSILPYIGETILHLPHRELHLGCVEKWYIVNPIALLGITLAYFKPFTKISHSGHIFLSTSASLLHIIMSLGTIAMTFGLYAAITFLLFLSVWIPCCFSDIVFPLLFTGGIGHEKGCSCCHHH